MTTGDDRDDRPFLFLHNGMDEHPKIAALSDAAFRALIRTWCYASRNLTDGMIPARIFRGLASARSRTELDERGLVTQAEGGYVIHDYLKHQRSATELSERRNQLSEQRARLREVRQEAGRRGGQARAANARGNGQANGLANGGLSHAARQANGKQKSTVEVEVEVEELQQQLGDGIAEAESKIISRPDVDRLCTLLADRIEANGSKRPEIGKAWRAAARLLIDKDGRTVEQVTRAIEWCQGDEFWRAIVLSMPKLREKYDQLQLAAKRGSNGNGHRRIAPGEFVRPAADAWMDHQ